MLGQSILLGMEQRLSSPMGSLEWLVSKQDLFSSTSPCSQDPLFNISDPMLYVQGTLKLGRLAKELAADVNVKRRAKGLLPRPVGCF